MFFLCLLQAHYTMLVVNYSLLAIFRAVFLLGRVCVALFLSLSVLYMYILKERLIGLRKWKHKKQYATKGLGMLIENRSFYFRFSNDTCTALESFQQNPNNNSLSSILPCDELVSAKSLLNNVGAGIYRLVNEVRVINVFRFSRVINVFWFSNLN